MRQGIAALGLVLGLLGGKIATAQSAKFWEEARHKLVADDIVGAGVTNRRVVDSMRNTPRHEFVPSNLRKYAYVDMALPIGEGQTISPPFVVAYMTEQIDPQPTDKVLEIGTGSGYQAAVLSPLVREVYSIEIVPALGRRAQQTLQRLGYKNVFTKIGDGYQGWPEHAPFDKIIVTCSPEDVPKPLVEQLREGGRLVIPLGERYQQMLYLMKKVNGKLEIEALKPTLFVPMTGTAESQRQVQPDPTKPRIVNGSFEESAGDPPIPIGWHYQRNLALEEAPDAPEGSHYVVFRNTIPGRLSQCLQGMPIDGRKVREIQMVLTVRGDEVVPGRGPDESAGLGMTFYDEQRRPVGNARMGPWRGSFSWQSFSARIAVPPRAREAIVWIGLLGATGELAVDEVQLRVLRVEE